MWCHSLEIWFLQNFQLQMVLISLRSHRLQHIAGLLTYLSQNIIQNLFWVKKEQNRKSRNKRLLWKSSTYALMQNSGFKSKIEFYGNWKLTTKMFFHVLSCLAPYILLLLCYKFHLVFHNILFTIKSLERILLFKIYV